jgi:hypothetical protein
MPRNEQAVRWEEQVARNRRAAGQSWKRIARFFYDTNNYAGLDITLRLKKQEQVTLARMALAS